MASVERSGLTPVSERRLASVCEIVHLTLCEKFHIIRPVLTAQQCRTGRTGRPQCRMPRLSSRLLGVAATWRRHDESDLPSHTPTSTPGSASWRSWSSSASSAASSRCCTGPGYNTNQNDVRRAADPVQPCAPRRRHGHRLPLLPYVGRGVRVRQHPADQDLHELPLADLDERADPRAGARQLPRQQAAARGRACTTCRISSTSTTAFT